VPLTPSIQDPRLINTYTYAGAGGSSPRTISENRARIVRMRRAAAAILLAALLPACGGGGDDPPGPRPDFALEDVNASSPTSGQSVSPRDYLGNVSAYYFGHAT
jgi:hypothetical protein